MLEQFRARGFKSLRDVDVELAPLVVLFGPNTSGKSNLLEALVLLSRVVTERTLPEAFDHPLRGFQHESFTMPSGGMQELLDSELRTLELGARIQSPDPNGSRAVQRHDYRIGIGLRPQRGELEAQDEYLVRLDQKGKVAHKPRIEREDEELIVRRLREQGQP